MIGGNQQDFFVVKLRLLSIPNSLILGENGKLVEGDGRDLSFYDFLMFRVTEVRS